MSMLDVGTQALVGGGAMTTLGPRCSLCQGYRRALGRALGLEAINAP